jgi:hypothetical protein
MHASRGAACQQPEVPPCSLTLRSSWSTGAMPGGHPVICLTSWAMGSTANGSSVAGSVRGSWTEEGSSETRPMSCCMQVACLVSAWHAAHGTWQQRCSLHTVEAQATAPSARLFMARGQEHAVHDRHAHPVTYTCCNRHDVRTGRDQTRSDQIRPDQTSPHAAYYMSSTGRLLQCPHCWVTASSSGSRRGAPVLLAAFLPAGCW